MSAGTDNTGAHRTHCCKKHGCKYEATGNNCPVYNGTIEQEFPCEVCDLARTQEAAILDEFAEWFDGDYYVSDNPLEESWVSIDVVVQKFLQRER